MAKVTVVALGTYPFTHSMEHVSHRQGPNETLFIACKTGRSGGLIFGLRLESAQDRKGKGCRHSTRGKKGCEREAAIQHLPGLSFQAQLGCAANSSRSLQIMSASTVLPMAQPWGLLSQYSDAALSLMI